MERRLAAILAADVQGYNHRTEPIGEGSTATLRMYRAVLEESIAAHSVRRFVSPTPGARPLADRAQAKSGARGLRSSAGRRQAMIPSRL